MICRCHAKDIDPKRPKSEQVWCLYTKDGKRLLGRHPTREKALNQERAVEVHKHGTASSSVVSSVTMPQQLRRIAAEIVTLANKKPVTAEASTEDQVEMSFALALNDAFKIGDIESSLKSLDAGKGVLVDAYADSVHVQVRFLAVKKDASGLFPYRFSVAIVPGNDTTEQMEYDTSLAIKAMTKAAGSSLKRAAKKPAQYKDSWTRAGGQVIVALDEADLADLKKLARVTAKNMAGAFVFPKS